MIDYEFQKDVLSYFIYNVDTFILFKDKIDNNFFSNDALNFLFKLFKEI